MYDPTILIYSASGSVIRFESKLEIVVCTSLVENFDYLLFSVSLTFAQFHIRTIALLHDPAGKKTVQLPPPPALY